MFDTEVYQYRRSGSKPLRLAVARCRRRQERKKKDLAQIAMSYGCLCRSVAMGANYMRAQSHIEAESYDGPSLSYLCPLHQPAPKRYGKSIPPKQAVEGRLLEHLPLDPRLEVGGKNP